jgi:hypothetical protein
VTLHDAGVMRKMLSGRIQIAWAGTLEPGAQAALVFRDAKLYKSGLPFWPEHRPGFSVTATAPGSGELNLRALIDSAQEPGDLQPGEARLLAALKEEIPGMTVSPAAPQVQHAALVIAHLKYGPGEDPQADRNTRPKGAVGGGGLSSRPANPPSSQPAPWDASIRTERLKTDGQQTAGLHADAAAAGHRWTTVC